MARRLLADPTSFSEILGVSKTLIQNVRLISCFAFSDNKLDPETVDILYHNLERQIFEEYPFLKKLPPSFHKYSHLAEFARTLVIISLINENAI